MKSVALSRYAFGFKRTLDHLKAWPLSLPPEVKGATIRYHTNDKGQSGMRLFVYQHLPQLKYHNPDVSFKIIRNDEPPQCAVELKYETGQSKSINTKNSEPSDIQKEIETLVKS